MQRVTMQSDSNQIPRNSEKKERKSIQQILIEVIRGHTDILKYKYPLLNALKCSKLKLQKVN